MSFLGPHINKVGDQMDWLRRARPRVAKILLDGLDPGWMRTAREASPRTFWVGRFVDYRDPADLVSRAEPYRGLIDALEGINEPVINNYDDMLCYADLEAKRCQILHRAGWKAVVGNFSTGTPEPGYWPAFYGALEAGDYLGLHEYSPQLPRDPRDDTWHQLRYLRVHERLPEGLRKPLIITECGIDDGRGGGWRRYGDEQAYLAYLRWYDQQLQSDSARWPIVGATVFCYGRFAQDPWESFDISGAMAGVLGDYIASHASPFWEEWEVNDVVTKYRIGPVFREFGWRITGYFGDTTPPYPATGHRGVDYACPEGTEVLAPFTGIVDLCGTHATKGNRINIVDEELNIADPDYRLEAVFYHLRDVPPFRAGDRVKRGQVVGYTGNTGQSTGPHLHFGLLVVRNNPPVWSEVRWLDPLGVGVELALPEGDAQLSAQLRALQAEYDKIAARLMRIKDVLDG